MACALNPIGDIYKTQVWQLSEAMGVPQEVIEKKPSADLWAGQTDEQELGFTYREVDELLYRMVDLRLNREELVAARLCAGVHRHDLRQDAEFPFQTAPAGHRQGIEPDHRPGFPIFQGLGEIETRFSAISALADGLVVRRT